jgi:hypothetical protein
MHQIKIVDSQVLQSVLRKVVARRGTHREAAKALGIGQTTFTRLLNGTVHKRLRSDTYRSIRKALSAHGIEWGLEYLFEESVLNPKGSLVQRKYESWLREEYERLASRAQPVFSELYGRPEYQRLFKGFLQRVARRPDLPPPHETRLWVALYRAVEPLGAASVTWGVERTWQEMDEAGELEGFLQAALKRERIMLNRERDLARLNRCKPPEEYMGWLAGLDEEEEVLESPKRTKKRPS